MFTGEHHKESIEVFDASYCSESTTETNVLVEKSSSEALQKNSWLVVNNQPHIVYNCMIVNNTL